MSLTNSWHTQLAIGILLNDEKELETKLNLLTEISLTTKNDETFKICERFRDRLCTEDKKEKSKSESIQPIHAVRLAGRNSGNGKRNKMDGE